MEVERATFPILKISSERRQHPDWPDSIPWDMIAPHAAQARANHYQSLEGLARRGGLSPLEMMCVLSDRKFTPYNYYTQPTLLAIEFIKQAVTDWSENGN